MIEIKRSAFVLSSTKKLINPGDATSIFLSHSGLFIFWAIVYGFVFYRDIPDMPTIIGATIIVVSGIYIINQQKKIPRN